MELSGIEEKSLPIPFSALFFAVLFQDHVSNVFEINGATCTTELVRIVKVRFRLQSTRISKNMHRLVVN